MTEQIIKSIVGIVVSGIIGYLVAALKNYKKKNKGLTNGIMILLQSNITNTFFYYGQENAIPDYMYKNLLNELKAYEDLGGDDYVHILAEHMKHWDITRTDILKEK